MNKKILWAVLAVVILAGGYFVLKQNSLQERAVIATDYKNIEYVIEGKKEKLGNNFTQYFGNELKTDLNGDGREDVVFLITRQPGGTGTFYYAVAALNLPAGKTGTEEGYVGSDGYFLGDRIAPQTTEVSRNPRHKNVIVVNYADRAPNDPMTAQPSQGKSVYLKLDPELMQWGVVLPDFEGESR